MKYPWKSSCDPQVENLCDRPSRIIAVQSLVLSIINYCISIWGSANLTIFDDAQKLLSFAAKVAKGIAKKFDHATPIIQELGWLKIKENHKLDICTTVFKELNGFYPVWYKKFPTVLKVTESITRQQNCLYVPKTRTDSGARCRNVTGPKLWNNLPSNITDAGSIFSFKFRLQSYFLNNTLMT